MKLKEYPVIYAGALHCIAASGVGRLFLNKVLGEKFHIVGGLGQGDPCPVPRYTIVRHAQGPWCWCLFDNIDGRFFCLQARVANYLHCSGV